MEKEKIINSLEQSPVILKELMAEMPAERMKERRIPGKWSAHEHACHLSKAQQVMVERVKRFLVEERPVFVPYFPGKADTVMDLLQMDLRGSLDAFAASRAEFVGLLRQLKDADWNKRAEHPEYFEYTPYIMARHILMHDHVHMYRIEELWLTKQLPH